ncbi:MAG: kinase, partial [Bacteroides sp.]|nr:kinase [Bacteroides sp.]
NLPGSSKRLKILFKDYLNTGYAALISGKLGNTTAEKLTEEGQRWALAHWATPLGRQTLTQLFNEYNARAEEAGWKPLKSEQTLYNFLNKPEIKRLWWGTRYGELKAKEKFVPQNRTLLASCRDANWYGDGTKLNYFYRDENGKVATCNVYEVVDEYSECLLGYAVSKSEDFAAQYKAYRMALDFSGQKPFQITFDNQGGHKKLMAEEFFGRVSRLAIGTQPYNGKSKTIESVFKRLQEQFMRKDWFFTGMNITAHKAESRANMEFFEGNKASLPTLEEVVKIYAQRRQEWNHAPHPKTGRPRIEMYYSSHNDQCTPIKIWERIELFGLMTRKPITFRSSGLELTVQGIKYAYDVLGQDGFTDMEFRKKHTGTKFYVSYDLDDLSQVVLYEETPGDGRKMVAMAEKYITTHRAKQDQNETDRQLLAQRDMLNKILRAETQEEIETIMEAEGVHPAQHGLNMPRVRMNNRRRKTKDSDGYGAFTKAVSNLVPAGVDDSETDSFSGY